MTTENDMQEDLADNLSRTCCWNLEDTGMCAPDDLCTPCKAAQALATARAERKALEAAKNAEIARLREAFAKLEEEMRRYVYDKDAKRRIWALEKFGHAALMERPND